MHCANGRSVRSIIALFGLLAMVLSGIHAGPVAAHEGKAAHSGDVVSHGHAHDSQKSASMDGPNDFSGDLDADQGHHHCPSAAAPQLPHAELVGNFGKQILFASEVAFLRLCAAAPPLDPPKA